jgi:cytochrome c556
MKIALMFAAGLAVVAAPVLAQDGPIETRQKMMKAVGGATKAGGDMLKGAVPFDADKAVGVFKTMNDVAARYANYFPAGSDTGGNTEAAPAIWAKPAEFKAAVAKFEKDTAAAMAAKPATLAAFGQQFGAVTANCKSCHEAFRLKK